MIVFLIPILYALAVLIGPKVCDCSFRLHTLLFLFPTHLGPLVLYLDSRRTITNAQGSPLIVATGSREFCPKREDNVMASSSISC
jgi:hypothetical protein